MVLDDKKVKDIIQQLNQKEEELRLQQNEIRRIKSNFLVVQSLEIRKADPNDKTKTIIVTELPVDTRTGKKFVPLARNKIYDENMIVAKKLV